MDVSIHVLTAPIVDQCHLRCMRHATCLSSAVIGAAAQRRSLPWAKLKGPKSGESLDDSCWVHVGAIF